MRSVTRFGGVWLALSCAIATAQSITPNTGTTPQSAQVTTPFTVALSVTVKNAANSPVPGVEVTFTAPDQTVASGTFFNSGGSVTTATTNSSGVATASMFTANAHAGTYNVTASATGYTTAPFVLTNTAGPPTQMTANANTTPQSSQVGVPFGTALGVTVKDANSNPVPNLQVTFTAPAQTGASGTFANGLGTTQATTNASGVATATTFTANTHAGGPYTVTATASGPPVVNFSLTNTPNTASKLAFTTQPPANGTAGTPFSVVVQVQDSNGIVVSTSSAQVTITSTTPGVTGTTTVTAVNGVATFTNLVFNSTGSYTLTAASSGLTSATSTSIAIGAAAASQVVITTPPGNGSAGQALTPAVVAKIEDAFGNVVNSSAPVTASSTPPGVSGTLQVNAVSGVATFSNLVFNSAGSYTLTLSSAGLTSATSASFSISAGSGTKLAFSTQPPANGITGQALTPSVVVQVQDSGGNVVPGSTASVTISSTPAGVGGTVMVNAVNGVATFSSLSFASAGSYTLTASSTGLTSATSNSITITGPPSQVVFTTPPGNGAAGQALTPAVVAKIEDASGNVVAGSTAAVSVSSSPAGVSGTLAVNAVAGVATFGNLSFATPGSYTLTASSAGLTSATSASFTISAGPPSKLVITSQPPASGTAGQPLSSPVVVQVQDAAGNVITGSAAAVTINSTPAGVGGTLTVNAASGVATFSNLVFNTAGNYTLTASSTGLASATSTSVAIGPGTAAKLGFPVPPSNGTAGQALTPAVVVQVQDANGNVVTGSTAPVTISSTPANVGGTLMVNAVNGVATFSALSFTTPGSYTLTAASTGLASATSSTLTISPGSGNKLVITVQPPANGTAGQALTPAVVVQVQDSIGNVVTASSAAVSISSTPAGVSGTVTVNAALGVATFSNLVFNTAGTYTLTATSAGLSNATSTSVAIAPGTASKLGFAVQPSGGTSGLALTPAVTVQVQDAFGNLVPSSTAAVTISSTPTGVSGTLAANAATGVATFSNLVFPTTGNYTLTATSAGLASATTSSFTIGGLTITTTALNPATRSALFSQQLTATGGVLPYTWSMPAGTLADGVSLSTSGLISGTPTVAGNFAFTARVRDSVGAMADQALTLVVAGALTISSCPASNGIVGQSYSSSAVAAGGTLPYAWSFSAGSLPTGLTLSGLTGGVTGTPTASGVFQVTFQVTDKNGAAASQSCGFTIAPALSITTLTLSDASLQSFYTQTLLASGGKGPYTWALTLGTSLPQGLALSTSGVISGTPTQQGFFNFTITVTDSTQASVQQAFTINVVTGLIVGACPSNIAEVGFAYNSSLVPQGGTAPYTWSVAGTLPAGLQLNATAGTIAGTPTLVGVSQLTFTATDKSNRTATKQCSIDVRAALTIATATLSQGSTGASYSDAVTVSGGVLPFVFSTTAGSLPPGVTLDAASGALSGRPTTAGVFPFTVAVTDNLGAQATKALSISVTAGLTIPNCPTPVATVGQAYSGALVAQSGTAPYVWSLSSGSLPAGLALDSPNSVIAGVPATSGTSNFVLGVADSAPVTNSTTRACSIQVNAAPFTITSAASLPNALVGVKYTQTLTATGGVAPYSWLVAGGTLPDSFTLDATGVLSGNTAAAGTFNFTVQATDQSGTTARQNITLVVLAGTAPTVTITGLSDIVDPATQPTFGIQLAGAAYPAPMDGTVTLTVVPDSAVGVADPSVQFATGGQTLKFTVAANSTTPVFTAPVAALQTGTVAGTIQLSVKLSSNGSDVTPPNTPVRSIRIDRLAPRIVTMSVVRTSSGLEVHIVGYSTTREVTQGSFQFSVSGGSPLSAVVPMSDAGKAWFGSQQSLTFGGQFSLVQPFTLQGSVGTLTSVSATLSNAQGTSSAATANF